MLEAINILNIFLYFLVFMLGASIASFIFVFLQKPLATRGGQQMGWVNKSRSKCLICNKNLNFWELIPVFSYILLKGKCGGKSCKSKIPLKLFFGEILLGLWFLFSFFYQLQASPDLYNFSTVTDINIFSLFLLFLTWLFGSILFLLAVEDFESKEITSKYMYILLSISLVKVLFILFLSFDFYHLILYPLLIISPFWIIYFINKQAIGEADPYVFTAIALFFDTQFSVSLFLYSVWLGAAYGLYYLYFINKKFERNIQIPFLPIIFLSTLFILTFNYHVIKIQDILMLNEIFFSK